MVQLTSFSRFPGASVLGRALILCLSSQESEESRVGKVAYPTRSSHLRTPGSGHWRDTSTRPIVIHMSNTRKRDLDMR